MNKIREFFGIHLLRFSTIGSRATSKILYTSTPTNRMIVLAGDFNVNFSQPSARPLIEFLLDHFELHMINRPNCPTTKGGTTIDAIFCTHPENTEVHHLTSYFSYHNPILFFVKL